MSNTIDKLRGLVEALHARTASSKIDWKISSDKERLIAKLGEYDVEISEEPNDQQFGIDIRITVYSDNGDQVDTFTDQFFSSLTPVNVPMHNYYNVMSSLSDMARRQATGADKAIEDLLSFLGGAPVQDPAKEKFPDLDDGVPF